MPVTIDLPAALAERLAQLTVAAGAASRRGLDGVARGLSQRYRADRPASSPIISGRPEAIAYAQTRLPATYAAARFAFEELAGVVPDLAPGSLLDLGAGTGAATAAAWSTWDSLATAHLEDYSAAAIAVAEDLLAATDLQVTTRVAALTARSVPTPVDVAVAAYVLSEIDDAERAALVERLTAAARSAVVAIEPGTPAGFRRIIDVRGELIRRGWRVAAPCPHELACPVARLSQERGGDWCHAAVRLPRTREHRVAKGGERGYEDEKLAWVAALAPASGLAIERPAGRVLRHPEIRPGHIRLELCTSDGEIDQVTVTKRDKAAFRAARKIEWGQAWEL